jgi:hypothetical protein
MLSGRIQEFVKGGGANIKMYTSIYTPLASKMGRLSPFVLSVKWHILGVKLVILGTVLIQKVGPGPLLVVNVSQ